MNITISRYSAALLPLAIGVVGILTAAQGATLGSLLGWQTITQIVLLLVTTGVIYWLPLVPLKWQLDSKTVAAIIGAALTAVVAVVPDGHFSKANVILVVAAVLKALSAHIGVQIRTDSEKIVATKTGDAYSITNVAGPLVFGPTEGSVPTTVTHIDADGNVTSEDPAEVDPQLGKSDALVPDDGLAAPEPAPAAANTAAPVETPAEVTPLVPEPAKSAKLAAWVAFAEQRGYDPAEKLTKAALVARYATQVVG